MKRFFVNKYPVHLGWTTENTPQSADVGTAFTIIAISGNMFEIAPVKVVACYKGQLFVDAAMLSAGFTEQDFLD